MKVIFFGSTKFSLPIVKKINENFELLVVVISKPKPKGRGLKVAESEVAEWAKSVGVPILSPEDPNDYDFVENVSALRPDIFVLAAYGHILSADLLKIPRLGGVNVHPSLLPKYRGAAPIRRAIMAGEENTGITIFFMDEKIDHGDIIFQKPTPIKSYDTYGSLMPRLAMLSADAIVYVIKSIESGSYHTRKQGEKKKTYAGKIKKEETIINWDDKTEKIFNLIRALCPKPGARTTFRNKELKIIRALKGDMKLASGMLRIENKQCYVGTGDGSMVLSEVQPEGRTKITGLDFINGFHIKKGERMI